MVCRSEVPKLLHYREMHRELASSCVPWPVRNYFLLAAVREPRLKLPVQPCRPLSTPAADSSSTLSVVVLWTLLLHAQTSGSGEENYVSCFNRCSQQRKMQSEEAAANTWIICTTKEKIYGERKASEKSSMHWPNESANLLE